MNLIIQIKAERLPMTNRLPYKDNDDAPVLAYPCVVCGVMVPIWHDSSFTDDKPVYCDKHKTYHVTYDLFYDLKQ